MMKYITGFDEKGNASFHYYRERLMKNGKGFLWKGKVHEAVTPAGTIFYSPIEIEHRKMKPGDSDRNLTIYEEALKNGDSLEPRHQFYYGSELFFHEQYEEAVRVLEKFLEEPEGWVENQIDACLQLSRCYEKLGRIKQCQKKSQNPVLMIRLLAFLNTMAASNKTIPETLWSVPHYLACCPQWSSGCMASLPSQNS